MATADVPADVTATTVRHLGEHAGSVVRLDGWVYNSRSSGKLGFLMLRDGTGIIQCVLSRGDLGDEDFALFEQLTQQGIDVLSMRNKANRLEELFIRLVKQSR